MSARRKTVYWTKKLDNEKSVHNNARLRIWLLGILERRDIFSTKEVHEEKSTRNALPARKNFTIATLFRVLVFIYL